MVSGINFGNYSVAQLKELKNNGVEVPDEAIKAAETKEAEASKTDDNAEVKYEITDDASETNEAEEEVENAKEYGANLKTILETLMKKDEGFISDMATLQSEIDKYKTQTEETAKKIDDVSTETQKNVDATQEEAKTVEEQIEEKQKEYDEKMKELETLQEKESDILGLTKIYYNNTRIKNINYWKYLDINSNINYYINKKGLIYEVDYEHEKE